MSNLDKSVAEEILMKLQEDGYLFPHYELYKENNGLCLLGVGGYSYVYDMIDSDCPEKHYALKVIGFGKHIIEKEKFLRTLILQNALAEQTPYVARILDTLSLAVSFDEEGGVTGARVVTEEMKTADGMVLRFVLMERLENLLERDKFGRVILKNEELQTEKGVLKFAVQIGQAILMAHENHILHRDIKLENIFWDENEQVYKLGDFGIAKQVEGGNAETVVYTDGYGAPEIEYRLNESYNATADIYSFGVTLYLLLNELKFPGSGGYYVNIVQYSEEFVFPAPVNASVELTRIIRKMCSYHREDRYQSMREVLKALDEIGRKSGDTEELLKGFYGALETVTFQESGILSESDVAEEEQKQSDGTAAEHAKKPKTRIERKKEKEEQEREYAGKCTRNNVWLSILILLLLGSFQTPSEGLNHWLFLLLPVLVLTETFLQRLREFHVLGGIVCIIACVTSGVITGVWIPQIILIICVLFGVSGIACAGALGTGAWLLLLWGNHTGWFAFITEHDLGWIVLALTLFSVDCRMHFTIVWKKIPEFRGDLWNFVYDKVVLLMVPGGIVLKLLQRYSSFEIPEIVDKLHLVRTGLVLFVAFLIADWWNGESETESDEMKDKESEEVEDVHLDTGRD